ncbi:UDP-N-acetylmuramate dehydrogenase [Microbacteriaceae bacterium VKM Ac-2855]|nr:UDP-N-acetylmuramate dehydrogenase [Microbacteriaceae bacterium VKM Ac-2855]
MTGTLLRELTTMRVGGPAARLVEPTTESELVDVVRALWADDEPWLLLGGGSNTIVADAGFEGTVVRIGTRGIERIPRPADTSGVAVVGADAGTATRSVRLRVQAGESWDELVEYTVAHGLAGIEALSGIPGSCGAAPIQNIGAYGQELSSSLVAVTFLDFGTGELERLPAAELELGYRSSVFKHGRAGVVTAIEIDLFGDESGPGQNAPVARSQPIAYGQLANALGVGIGDRVPLRELREAVLSLRASKGMVLDASDLDSVSAGSFFTNPIVSEDFARALPADAPRWPTAVVDESSRVTPIEAVRAGYPVAVPPRAPAGRRVKLSAAWLIEHAGIGRGFRLPGSAAAISSKHTLALTNRGDATAEQIAELARYVQGRVLAEFGVLLQPEPVLVGVSL